MKSKKGKPRNKSELRHWGYGSPREGVRSSRARVFRYQPDPTFRRLLGAGHVALPTLEFQKQLIRPRIPSANKTYAEFRVAGCPETHRN